MISAARLFWTMLANRTTVAAWIVASGIVAVAGPFGTFFSLELPLRFFFWAALIGITLVVSFAVLAILRVVRPDYGEWQETLVLSLFLAIGFSPLLRELVAIGGGMPAQEMMSLVEMGAFIVLLPIGVTALRRILREPRLSQEVPEPRRRPRLLQRLPEKSGRKILRISVRDHYVDVVTDRTSETLLMRFSDAIAEAEGIRGLQVHRSHWVAKEAVAGVDREKGRMFLRLVDGSRVPVSRGYRDAVAEAGIADDSAA